jgi:hypothetical protein
MRPSTSSRPQQMMPGMLSDFAGAGSSAMVREQEKGRQVTGILLDNWFKGRRRALWVSKSDKLIEDAQRDWSALSQERLLITSLARFRQRMPIRLDQCILLQLRHAAVRRTRRKGFARAANRGLVESRF